MGNAAQGPKKWGGGVGEGGHSLSGAEEEIRSVCVERGSCGGSRVIQFNSLRKQITGERKISKGTTCKAGKIIGQEVAWLIKLKKKISEDPLPEVTNLRIMFIPGY